MPDATPPRFQPGTRGVASKWRRVFSEPLLHFLALGGLILAATVWITWLIRRAQA